MSAKKINDDRHPFANIERIRFSDGSYVVTVNGRRAGRINRTQRPGARVGVHDFVARNAHGRSAHGSLGDAVGVLVHSHITGGGLRSHR